MNMLINTWNVVSLFDFYQGVTVPSRGEAFFADCIHKILILLLMKFSTELGNTDWFNLNLFSVSCHLTCQVRSYSYTYSRLVKYIIFIHKYNCFFPILTK